MARVGTTNLNLGTWTDGENPGAGSQSVDSTGLNGNQIKLDNALGTQHNVDGTHKSDVIDGINIKASAVDGATLETTAATGTKTIRVKDGGIGTAKIADAAITAVKLANNVIAAKRWVGILNQSGSGDPVASTILNSLGGTPLFTRSSAGVYYMTLTGAFTSGKTFCVVNVNGYANAIYANWYSANTIAIYTVSLPSTFADSLMVNVGLSVEVFT